MSRRWGIMGTGSIAASMTRAIVDEGGSVVAVSSASAERAAAFAAEHGIARSYGRHHDLTSDPDVEVVHVATTNERHHLDVRACVEAGLPVLAEKSFALDLSRTREVLELARERGVFVMEAMWMKLQPGFIDLQRRIADGEIGPPRLVQADFGIAANGDTARRWFSPELGGGALLDVGVYPLTFAIAVLGPPTRIAAVGELAATGVDAQVAVAMQHDTGISSWSCSFVADSGIEATVAGPGGSLRLRSEMHNSPGVTRRVRDEAVDVGEAAGHELGLRWEVREVHACLEAGHTESVVVPHAATLEVMAALDEVRRQIGVDDL
jgi:predicted dehydrogenase